MKCPECDFEQPDDSILCPECGLSIEMWRAANPEAAKVEPKKDEGLAFPVQDEEKPAPEGKPVSKEEKPAEKDSPGSKKEPAPKEKPVSAEKIPTAPEKSSKPAEEKKEGKSDSQEEKSAAEETPQPAEAEKPAETPGEKKGFKLTPFHYAGLGLFAAIALSIFFFSHRSPKPPAPAEGTQPTAVSTPGSPSTPGTGVPITSPLATGTPENSFVLPTHTPALEAVGVKHHAEKPTQTPTSADIQPEQPSPTPTAKPAVPAEPPPGAIWAATEIPSPTPTPSALVTAEASPSPAQTPGPTDLLETSEPLKALTPTATP